MRGYLGMCELGFLSYESGYPLVHVDIDNDNVIRLVGLVDNVEEQVNIKVCSVSESSFFSFSLG
jgi:hypothetical protein